MHPSYSLRIKGFEMSSNFSDHDKFCHGFRQWRYKLYKYKVTYFYYLCTLYSISIFGDGQLLVKHRNPIVEIPWLLGTALLLWKLAKRWFVKLMFFKMRCI